MNIHLTQAEIDMFYKLWYAMVWGINEKHKVIPHFKKPKYGIRVSVGIEEFMKVRNSMWDNPEWIDEFLEGNDNGEFTEQERNIIIKWRKHFIIGDFLVVKHLSKYTVLMTFGGDPVYLYGVHGISDPLKNALPYPVPIVENLGAGNPVAYFPKNKKRKAIVNSVPESVPTSAKILKAMAEKYNEIAEIITRFSREKLDEEYQELCLKALAKLCRKRPSPLLKGRNGTWACGIVYAIGSNNFIFDKSQDINMTATEVAMWFFEINGYLMDIRNAPYEIQKEAYARGWIPYIPHDKE